MKPCINIELHIATYAKRYMILNQDGEILYEADIDTMKTAYISSDYKQYKIHLRRLIEITKILQSANEKITARYLNEK